MIKTLLLLAIFIFVLEQVSSWSSNSFVLKTSRGSSTKLFEGDFVDEIWTEDQLLDYASSEGIELSFTTLGPGYRAVVRAKQNTSQVLGYCEGFLRPGGKVLHVDKMEVFKKMMQQASNEKLFRGGGTIYGPGLLLGYMCLLHGKMNGYATAEFLAIDDEENQHRKLVQYYKRSGFKIIKYVGDDYGNIPDRLIWGGRGTLMRENIDTLLQSWTTTLEKAKKKSSAK
mmetsp:Transcript_12463/g.18288  ORF Transcript_12463/g.18288 Transcript_12463/m.18288 type:complete len:227 (-) Transcript_12463:41-721(-)